MFSKEIKDGNSKWKIYSEMGNNRKEGTCLIIVYLYYCLKSKEASFLMPQGND